MLFHANRLRTRYAVAVALAGLLLAISFLTRVGLLLRADIGGAWSSLPGVFAIGLAYDLITASFALAPLILWLALLPDRIARWRLHRWIINAGTALSAFLLLLNAVSEFIFWEEFASRFNFIAVDYLIYTQEVLGNIWQSYPVGKILILLAIVAALLARRISTAVGASAGSPLSGRARLAGIVVAIGLPVLLFQTVSSTGKERFGHDALNELAGNGLYEFAAAARNNEMEYTRLYAARPDAEVFDQVRARLSQTSDGWRSPDPQDPERLIRGSSPERRLNVVLISVESLGAEFLGAWGNPQGLTPRLDALAAESLVFRNVYATGNRTVRGLEALSLALPPTPGQSIVKRPKNQHMFTLGSIFEDKGYTSQFIYGGYGYFDNMSAYFAANDYDVYDRQEIPKEKIHYENIWGVADEDLFTMAVEKISAARAKGKPVFAHIMTTSNHRPYTYPPGRIDIPPGTGREGAVKYTDWAIGHFIDIARKQPWFADTLFVITADHGANARGTREIPIDSYRIPVLFYAPAHISPQRVERLMSQIDIAPTLLGQLGFSYRSKFFGEDIFRMPPGAERAFVANYLTLGYLRGGHLVTLQPRRVVKVAADVRAGPPAGLDETTLTREAIAWYEAASLSFRRGLYNDEERADPSAPPTATAAHKE